MKIRNEEYKSEASAPISREVEIVQQETSETQKKIRRGEAALRVAGPSLKNDFIEELLGDLWKVVGDSRSLISALNDDSLNEASDNELQETYASLMSLAARIGNIISGCSRLGLDQRPEFVSALRGLVQVRDRFESFAEGIELSLQPAFHAAVELAAAAIVE